MPESEEWSRRAGPGIAIPDLEVAVVGLEPTELQEKLDISFQSSVDDLDYVDIALIELDSGDRLAFIRRQRAPSQGQSRISSAAKPHIGRSTSLSSAWDWHRAT
jgi:hypothetical protein